MKISSILFILITLISLTIPINAQNNYTVQIRVEDYIWDQTPDYNSSLEWNVDFWGEIYYPNGQKIPESEYSNFYFEWYQDDSGQWALEGEGYGANHHWTDGGTGQFFNIKLRIIGNGVDVMSDIIQVGKSGSAQKVIVNEYRQDGSGYLFITPNYFSFFTNPHWYGPPNIITGDYSFILTEDDLTSIRLHPYELTSHNQKFNRWNTESDIINFNSFSFPSGVGELNAYFKNRITNVNIQIGSSELTGAAILGFKDPWLPDNFIGENLGYQNQGMQAPFKYYSSIDFSNTNFAGYKGLFLNQNPNFLPDIPNYSISIPSSIYLPQTGQTHNLYLQSWVVSGASLEDENALETGVVFTSISGVNISANVKASQLSDNLNGFDNSSQRKFIKTNDGVMHHVYESMGKVWYEKSTNNGGDWILMNGGKALS